MNTTPIISVVCPTFNATNFIQKTIDCLLSQSQLPYQIVFSDDGSTDNTVSLLQKNQERFSQKGILFKLVTNPHQGPGATRNAGIAAATGDWIAFLDADDEWHTDKIKRTSDTITGNPQVNFINHWEEYIKLDNTRSLIKSGTALANHKNLPQKLYLNNNFSTSATVLKKELLNTIGVFDTTLPASQDYELWLRLAPKIKLTVIEEVLGYYIERPGSITTKPYTLRYFCLMRIFFRHWQKGGLLAFISRVLRATVSKQWLIMFKFILTGKLGQAH